MDSIKYTSPMDSVKNPGVVEFFRGRSIFITGASGFMGKVLVEKLLRSCPGIVKIYILLRPGRAGTIQEKKKKLTSYPLFDRLKSERPGDLESKLVAIEGDMTKLKLGLRDEDRCLITREVSIVYHVAATVRFNQSLKDAIIMNVRGTRELCGLVLDIRTNNPNAIFQHVSTAFSNCDRKVVEECLYPPHADWRRSIQIAEDLDEHTLQILCAKYTNGALNTYVFTKSLAEHVVNDLCGAGGRTIIMRPSIVTPSQIEPVPGWIDNFNGPTGILVAGSTGLCRTSCYKGDGIADYMPVDGAINYMIITTWKHGVTTSIEAGGSINVYNATSSGFLKITMHEVCQLGCELLKEVPFSKMLWAPCTSHTENVTLYYINVILFHMMPAIVLDGILAVLGQKPIGLVKLHRKIYIATMALNHFLTNEWNFKNDQLLNVEDELPREEYEMFRTNVENIEPTSYFRDTMYGVKLYLLKENMKTMKQDQSHYKRMIYLDVVVKAVLYVTLIGLAFTQLNCYYKIYF